MDSDKVARFLRHSVQIFCNHLPMSDDVKLGEYSPFYQLFTVEVMDYR